MPNKRKICSQLKPSNDVIYSRNKDNSYRREKIRKIVEATKKVRTVLVHLVLSGR